MITPIIWLVYNRLRRDGRRAVEDSDRVRASLHAPDPKLATRNPTRVLPDVAGKSTLAVLRHWCI